MHFLLTVADLRAVILSSPHATTPHRTMTTRPFEIVPIAGKGLGAIATQPIRRGTLVLEERPLLTVDGFLSESSLARKAHLLSPSARDALNALKNIHPSLPRLIGLTKTNSLPMGDTSAGASDPASSGGVYEIGSRFNHDCTPSINHFWHPVRGVETFYATRDIAVGEELTIYYTIPYATRAARQSYLRSTFKFTCTCATCNLAPSDLAASDERRTSIQRAEDVIPRLTHSPTELISLVRKAIADLDREGLVVGKGSFCYDAYQAAAAWGDAKNAKEWAKASCEFYSVEMGPEAESYAKVRRYQLAPTTHPAWGMHGRKTVGGPQ
ncbi:hypothetical protein RQP46_000143 [Phenoliferia psychrophenolica]